MHNCLEEIRENIMENDPEINYVYFKLSNIKTINRETGAESKIKTGQAVEIGYNHIKKDGTMVRKSRKSFVTHTHCPFCGKKY
jgi:hypothetical protein